jgi:phage replication O-like protein O
MGPQCEDGYTKIANELLEALCLIRIPGESMQIFLVILRKTYGYGKKSDRIALSQFVEATGIRKTHVLRAIQKLELLNIIVTQKGNVNNTTYEINKHYATWQALPKKVTLPKKGMNVPFIGNEVTQKGNNRNPKRDIQKKERNLTKETITKEKGVVVLIPEWLPLDAWEAYLDKRKQIKKLLEPKNFHLAFNKLEKLMEAGFSPRDVLEQSTFNSWQGLFEIKGVLMGNSVKDRPRSFREQVNRAAGDAFERGEY